MNILRFKPGSDKCGVCGMPRANHLADNPSPSAWPRPWLTEFSCRGWRELFVPLLLVLLLSGCGLTTSGPPETCGADWKRYDIAPGACLAAFSGGVDWQEFTAQPDRGHDVDQLFLSPGIGVDCSDARQFGLTMRATDEPLSVAIKANAGTVEEYAAGDPACALMVPRVDRF